MQIRVKRVYEAVKKADGTRVLVDRLWPRGVTKATAKIDMWAKELAPSNLLRAWFHHNKADRFLKFIARYRAELSQKSHIARDLIGTRSSTTLVTAVRDVKHSHIPTLVAFLKRL